MGFWLFMLTMDLLTPLLMLGIGLYFLKSPPQKINKVFGYRTALSMKNQETWQFAHHYCGKLWRAVGLFLLAASIVAMLFAIKKPVDTVGIYGGTVCAAQLFILIGSIFPTEIALRKNFDEYGKRTK